MKHIHIRNPKKPSAGFSLIEMLVVIAIIGIIAALAIPGIQNWQEQRAKTKTVGQAPAMNPAAVPHPNNNIDYAHFAKLTAAAYTKGVEDQVFKPSDHTDIDACLNAILVNSAKCNASSELTTAIASRWITAANMKNVLSKNSDGLHLINGTAMNLPPAAPKKEGA